ncbi:hypothetical protein pipiens_014514 [Culex pipiens pipiens]|uniref:Uncharacterized protein n=1 Tax=Culex pipiens pipiens TaxID=38569 RepID=A0ABD1CUF8_CULPP
MTINECTLKLLRNGSSLISFNMTILKPLEPIWITMKLWYKTNGHVYKPMFGIDERVEVCEVLANGGTGGKTINKLMCNLFKQYLPHFMKPCPILEEPFGSFAIIVISATQQRLAAKRTRTSSTPGPFAIIRTSTTEEPIRKESGPLTSRLNNSRSALKSGAIFTNPGKLAAKRKHTVPKLGPVKVIHTSAADQLIRGILCDHHETRPGVRACSGVQPGHCLAAIKLIPQECWPR